MVSQELLDLALACGSFSRSASRFNLLSRCDVFGLSRIETEQQLAAMLQVVQGWRDFFVGKGVEARSVGASHFAAVVLSGRAATRGLATWVVDHVRQFPTMPSYGSESQRWHTRFAFGLTESMRIGVSFVALPKNLFDDAIVIVTYS